MAYKTLSHTPIQLQSHLNKRTVTIISLYIFILDFKIKHVSSHTQSTIILLLLLWLDNVHCTYISRVGGFKAVVCMRNNSAENSDFVNNFYYTPNNGVN